MRHTLWTLALLLPSLAGLGCSSGENNSPSTTTGAGGADGVDTSSCSNSSKDGQETDTDCGGPLCPRCEDGLVCVFDLDCLSLACSAGFCGKPSCSDHRKDGDESDTDCGGSDKGCHPCTDGGACLAGSDCASGLCLGGLCRAATCMDGRTNGGETDQDCGGSCMKCGPGKSCKDNGDCGDNVCSSNVCVGGSCVDGILNQDESAIDCGGSCAPCADGLACKGDGDCQSDVCAAGLCAVPSCTDGHRNGTESASDCGGECGPCATGQTCNWNADCGSFVCAPGAGGKWTCQAPSCTDVTMNEDETGVDCGGPTCGPCPAGQPCQHESDCLSTICTDGFCQAPTCSDGRTNGDESDVDCGGMTCMGCLGGKLCSNGKDCYSTVCLGDGTCTSSTCSDRLRNQDESDVDCGGSVCGKCGWDLRCDVNGDCKTGWCNPFNKRCDNIVCGDGIVQPGETCDDKNTVNDDDCNNDCQVARCGDGILQPNTNLHSFKSPVVTSPYGFKGHVSYLGSQPACWSNDACIGLDKNGSYPEHGICQALGFGRASSVKWQGGQGSQDNPSPHLNNWRCSKFICQGSGIADHTPAVSSSYMLNTIDCEGEACDNGAANSDVDADACRTDCTLPRCGDGVLDTGEECDDGNLVKDDGCDYFCHKEK